MRILLVEDNPSMSRFIQQGLTEHGHLVEATDSGRNAEDLATAESYDLIILDLMLPDQDGLLTCRNLRRRGVRSRILVLTALSSTSDKIAGLDAGADDYLTKPFEFEELVARARALLRRGEAQESSNLRFADLEMDLLTRSVSRAGTKVKLTSKEFALLELFMRNPHRVLTRTSIAERLWDISLDRESNVIDVYVSSLRRKIDRGFDRRILQTVIGAGYKLSDEPDES